MIRFVIRTAVTALGVLLVAYMGLISIDGFAAGEPLTLEVFGLAFVFALVLGLVNGIVRPIVKFLALPITILTLGLFGLVINIAMFYLAAGLIPGITAGSGFIQTAFAALIVAIASAVATSLTKPEEDE